MNTTIATATTEQLHAAADQYRSLIGKLNNADEPDFAFINKNQIVLATIVTEIRNRNNSK